MFEHAAPFRFDPSDGPATLGDALADIPDPTPDLHRLITGLLALPCPADSVIWAERAPISPLATAAMLELLSTIMPDKTLP